jgi:hypothetical protein
MLNSTLSYLIKLHYPEGLSLAGNGPRRGFFGGRAPGCPLGLGTLAGAFERQTDGRTPGTFSLAGRRGAGGRALFCPGLPAAMGLAVWIVLVMVLQLTATALTTVADALAADVAVGSAKVKIMTCTRCSLMWARPPGRCWPILPTSICILCASCYLAARRCCFWRLIIFRRPGKAAALPAK